MAEGNRRERRGEPRGRRRPDRRDFSKDRRDPETAAFRVRSELGTLEKAYSQKDFAKQKASLEEILKALKPLRLRSIDELDFNTRGRLITTLLRVGRQTAPPESPAPVAAAAQEPAASTAADEASAEPASAEGAPTDEASPDQPPAAQAEAAPQQEEPAAPPVDEKATAFAEMMFALGSIWRAVADPRRAEVAFAASGRQPESETAPPPIQEHAADWREQAKQLEGQKRTRDAARLHERNQSFAEAARLFEAGRDLKSAARSAIAAKDLETARRILKLLPVEEGRNLLEKAGAYELLMERYVEASDFQNVARLYERAKQFDQAALAWERAGKLGSARKAYQRAKDEAGAQRIRDLEVEQLVQRGDRLGAAVLLMGENRREEAAQVLLALPAAKAFHFLQKAKLDEEAMALARREIQQANAENKPSVRARWLEWTGDTLAAAEAWEAAERKDKALEMYEQVGQWQKAAQLAEALGRKEKALELYHRAGDRDSAARLELAPEEATAGPPSPAAE